MSDVFLQYLQFLGDFLAGVYETKLLSRELKHKLSVTNCIWTEPRRRFKVAERFGKRLKRRQLLCLLLRINFEEGNILWVSLVRADITPSKIRKLETADIGGEAGLQVSTPADNLESPVNFTACSWSIWGSRSARRKPKQPRGGAFNRPQGSSLAQATPQV